MLLKYRGECQWQYVVASLPKLNNTVRAVRTTLNLFYL